MQYKTIVQEMLQQRPEMHEQLRKNRKLLQMTERYAIDLRNLHQSWKELLSQSMKGSNESQIASQALEMALKDLEERLPSDSPPEEAEPLSLEGAMAFIKRHTPPE